MFKHILVPVDGSPLAERALPVAARIARATGGTVTLFYVLSMRYGYGPYLAQAGTFVETQLEAESIGAKMYLDRLARSAVLEGVKTRKEVMLGLPAETILTYARISQADLIVMSTHGYTGLKRWALGSVAQKVARLGPIPVLILRSDSTLPEGTTHPMHVLVPLDGSPLAEAALLPAAQLCAALAPDQVTLHLVRIVQPIPYVEGEGQGIVEELNEDAIQEAQGYLNQVAEYVREGNLAPGHLTITSSIVSSPDIVHTLIRAAEQGESFGSTKVCDRCDIIAVATHGRHGMTRWLQGSVTESMLGAIKLPLFVVHAQQGDATRPNKVTAPLALTAR
jgi:nucleotide-binding universal stress UspA family protein